MSELFPLKTTRQYGDGRQLVENNWGLEGKKVLQRTWTGWCYDQGYRGENLVKRVGTDLGESQLFVGAWHDNLVAGQSGWEVVRRDCGGEQIDILAKYIDTPTEFALRTVSLDPEIYIPVAKNNIKVGWGLFQERKFDPWVAYKSGWATFPEWWVWHQDADGNPIGPWIATGRYVQQAIRAVANFHYFIKKDYTSTQALALAMKRQIYFKVHGLLAFNETNGVYWAKWPDKPSDPPADGIGPRPVPIPLGV